ncbi:MAG: hypothetical protein ACOX2V_04160 [Clostridia bacterium]|jgi:hypothetical protein
MGIIQKDKSKKIFKLSLSLKDFKENLKIINDDQYIYSSNGLKYLLVNVYLGNNMLPDQNGNMNLFFYSYYETTKDFVLPFDFKSESIYFTLNNSIRKKLSILDGIEIKESNYVIKFFINGSQLEASLQASKTVIEKMNFSLMLFMYFFCILGEFVSQKGVNTYRVKSKSNELVRYYYYPSNNRYTCSKYTGFTVPIDAEMVSKTFPVFVQIHNNTLYPARVFIQSQSTIGYCIQQRVALILNALEGFLKRTIEKEEIKLAISKSNKRKILASVENAVREYLNSAEFLGFLKGLANKENIDSEKIVQRMKGTLGCFTEYSFDEILEFSKSINKAGYKFIKAINMPVKFWKRCKDHRNFHAHLTDDTHKGFNGIQSVYAVYTLSSYFRLLILELSSFDITEDIIINEANLINEWLKNKRISTEVAHI